MSDPWLTIVGIGEDGLVGLTDASRRALAEARIIFGAARHLSLARAGTRGRPWPVPFDISDVLQERGTPVVVLASGDPFWFGAGGVLAERLAAGEWRAFPAPGVFSLAAARLGWRLEDTVCIGLHAAPLTRLHPLLFRNCRVLATMRDGAAPTDLAEWLTGRGMGAVRLTVLERLGGSAERIRTCDARDFNLTDLTAPLAVALDGTGLTPDAGPSSVPGRPESDFAHDGQITKSPIRAITLAALAPRPDALLWDIGGGSGSVSVEWALAGGRAITIEPRFDRLSNIRSNIERFGLDRRIKVVADQAPKSLPALPLPDAVFVGGGADAEMFERLWTLLYAGTRLVANAVTLEAEVLLTKLYERKGGDLHRIEIAQAGPLGNKTAWKAAYPVVQWSGAL